MKFNVTIEIDDEELKKLFNLKSEEEFNPDNRIGEQLAVSLYTRVFDDSCVGWSKSPEYNRFFLITQQNYCNDLLRSRGHLFLNEVYDILGFPRTKAGTTVGWVYDEEKPIGDNFVDFGLNDERNSDFLNGYKSTAMLFFNVNGDIMKHI